MTNPNKTKGSSAERAVVDHLRATGWPHAERRLAGSSKDRGDIAGVVGVVIEVKNCARTDLAGWLAEAEQERANDRADYGVVWHKRRGRANAADWFVTMDGATFTRLLAAAGYGSGTEPRPVVVPYQPGQVDDLEDIPLPGMEVACPSRYAAPTGAVVGCRQTGLHNVHSNLAAGGDRVAWMTGDLSEVA